MVKWILLTYDWTVRHRRLTVLAALLLAMVFALLLTRQDFSEDISDFLPLDSKYQRAMKVWQHIGGADRVFVLFTSDGDAEADADSICLAVDHFVSTLDRRDTTHLAGTLVSQVDMDRMAQLSDFVYSHMPYFLTAADYARMDSLMAIDGYIPSQLAADKQLLMFPGAGLLAQSVSRDPLQLFTPVLTRLQQQGSALHFENYNGYIFTPDMQTAVVMLSSSYGGSETEHNAALVALLDDCVSETTAAIPHVSIRLTGSPVIAVGNARQIKSDSLLAVSLALVLIVALLYAAFRSFRNMLLVVVSIGWGWLFAMAGMSLAGQHVSMIVIGISSVILGIAVNYPLHLIAHLRHTPDVRTALSQIVAPLLVGNITTVGAFMALVPLRSVALRHLGLFSCLLLVGTILFVLLFLPHLVAHGRHNPSDSPSSPLADTPSYGRRSVVWLVAGVTLVLGFFSSQTTFDTNLAHINYMTDRQRVDLALLASLAPSSPASSSTFYAVAADSTLDGALSKNSTLMPRLEELRRQGCVDDIQGCQQFLCSRREQQQRLARWHDFVQRYARQLTTDVSQSAIAAGFAPGAFDRFQELVETPFQPCDPSVFLPLATAAFPMNLAIDSTAHSYSVVSMLHTSERDDERIAAAIDNSQTGDYVFDVAGMNSSIASRLSDDFNYIGWACALIVFFFLWASLGCIELAVLSFLPMAVSWVWILGLMALCGIQFNVVNVILATFIFGQGDDYTIFMTEGCQYEYAWRRTMLASYKRSIMLSAAIMFIGIGALVFARHPALHSLAVITIVGMSSVVLMACLLPPLVFRWLVCDGKGWRRQPLTLRRLLFGASDDPYRLVADRYRYRGAGIAADVNKTLRRLHREGHPLPAASHIVDDGWGETALLVALQHPDMSLTVTMACPDRLPVARHAAADVAPNISYLEPLTSK